MEIVAGGILLALGVVIVIFGTGAGGLAGSRLGTALHAPRWVDTAVNWAIGGLCAWFGIAIMFGAIHF
jgi:hypothetical protein